MRAGRTNYAAPVTGSAQKKCNVPAAGQQRYRHGVDSMSPAQRVEPKGIEGTVLPEPEGGSGRLSRDAERPQAARGVQPRVVASVVQDETTCSIRVPCPNRDSRHVAASLSRKFIRVNEQARAKNQTENPPSRRVSACPPHARAPRDNQNQNNHVGLNRNEATGGMQCAEGSSTQAGSRYR
jgi:hypothetical protein